MLIDREVARIYPQRVRKQARQVRCWGMVLRSDTNNSSNKTAGDLGWGDELGSGNG